MRVRAGLRLLVLASVTCLSGCVSVGPDTPEPRRYLLVTRPAPDTSPGYSVAGPLAWAVSEPGTAPGLDTDRIAVIRNRRELSYYADARWAAPLPLLLRDYLYEQLQAGAAGTYGGGGPTTTTVFVLKPFVRDFQAEYAADSESQPELRVTLITELVNLRDDQALARVRVSRHGSAGANTLTAVTDGLADLLREVVAETVEALGAQLRTTSASPR